MPLGDYHLFAIPTSVKDAEMGIEFSELENTLGGGYYAQVLFGSENGERSWRLTLPTLTGTTDRTVTGINGETLSWEEYLWDLFCEQKVNGTPFAYQDLRSGNYYLARFAQKELTYQRMLVKLYTTGIELKQWRISGETVFSPDIITQTRSVFDGDTYPDSGTDVWEPTRFGVVGEFHYSLDGVGTDVISAVSGSRNIVRFSSTTNDGVLTANPTALTETYYDIFLLMKIREATFSNNSGIFTGSEVGFDPPLIGESGTTKFFNIGHANFTYKLDGVEYAQTNQQAPMNEWGIVHLRFGNGVTVYQPQLGSDRDFAGRHAEMDLAYFFMSSSPYPTSTVREIMEHLSILKALLA